MKKFRILSVLLVLLFAISVLPSTALAAGAENDIFKVIGLNVDVKDDQIITRYDLAKVATSLGGLSLIETGKATFVDVPEKHWAFPVVNTVTTNGYMDGLLDGSFLPEAEATTADAAQVLMNLLGYGYFGKQANWNTSDYLIKAKNIGLLNGTNSTGKNLDGATFKKMIRNMLVEHVVTISSMGSNGTQYVVDEEMSYIQSRYGYYVKEGVMQAAGKSAISGASAVSAGKVKVAGVTYRVVDGDYSDFLGYEVRIIVDKNEAGANLLYMEKINTNEDGELYIAASDIENFSGLKLSYRDEDGNIEQANVSMTSQLFLNGQKTSFDSRLMQPLAGSVKLVDTNGDELYDIIYVTYEIYYQVSGAFENEYIGDGITGRTLTIEDIELNVYENGKKSALSSVKNEAVIAVTPGAIAFDVNGVPYADNINLDKVSVDTGITVVKGVITGKGVYGCLVDDVEYTYSKYYSKLVSAGVATLPVLGKETVVYINSYGEIVYVNLDAEAIAANRSYKYGYLVIAAPKTAASDGLVLQIFSQDAQMLRTETANEFKFNGSKAKSSDVMADPVLCPGGTFTSQLIAYEANDEGKITALYSAVDNSATVGYEGYDLINFNKEYDNSSAFYRYNFEHLYSSDDNSMLFEIPSDLGDTDSYVIKTGSSIFTREVTYDIELYDADDKYNIGVGVVDYSKMSGGGTLDARRDLDINHFYGIESFIVEEKNIVLNAKGEEVIEITGFTYDAPTGGEPSWKRMSLIASDDDLPDTDGSSFGHIYSDFYGVAWKNLVPGDVIHYELDVNGEVERFRLVFRESYLKDGSGNVIYKTLGGQTSTTYTVAGVIDKVFADGNFLFRDGAARSVATLNKARPKAAELKNVKIFIFENGKARNATASELRPEEPAFFISESGNLYDVIVYRD